VNAYSLSKHAEESMAICLGRRYEIPTVVLRYSIVQGSRQSVWNAYSGVCRIFSLSYLHGRAPTIYEDGLQCRDFVNVHDVVDANLLALRDSRADFNVYCVGGGRPHTVRAFDRVVARAFGKEHMQPHVPSEFRFGDTRHACSDISKLKALGWMPRRTVEDSVAEYRDYLCAVADLGDVVTSAANEMRRRAVLGRVTTA
jgi:dTDP-L-rhamnose 4-epimerase